MKFNLNQQIRFQLRKGGIQAWQARHPGPVEEGQWLSTQLHDFMAIFGDQMFPRFDPPVDPEIEILVSVEEHKKEIEKYAETLFRTPDGWPSMQRHDQPGSPRNLLLIPAPGVEPQELTKMMRASFTASVLQLIQKVLG